VFNTSIMDAATSCLLDLNFDMPSTLSAKRVRTFNQDSKIRGVRILFLSASLYFSKRGAY